MGCAQASQKSVAMPTLLTSKRAATQADKYCKQPCTVPVEAVAAVHADAARTVRAHDLKSMKMLQATAADDCEEGIAIPAPAPLTTTSRPPTETYEDFPSTFASRCKVVGAEGADMLPLLGDSFKGPPTESFASSYSAATNFSFGPKLPAPSLNSLGSTRRPTPREEAEDMHSARIAAKAKVEAAPEPFALISEETNQDAWTAVENTVHALVGAGEDAWSQAKLAWSNPWGLESLVEEDEEEGRDMDGKLEKAVDWRPFGALRWTCGPPM